MTRKRQGETLGGLNVKPEPAHPSVIRQSKVCGCVGELVHQFPVRSWLTGVCNIFPSKGPFA